VDEIINIRNPPPLDSLVVPLVQVIADIESYEHVKDLLEVADNVELKYRLTEF
jgi:hypothetical protein